MPLHTLHWWWKKCLTVHSHHLLHNLQGTSHWHPQIIAHCSWFAAFSFFTKVLWALWFVSFLPCMSAWLTIFFMKELMLLKPILCHLYHTWVYYLFLTPTDNRSLQLVCSFQLLHQGFVSVVVCKLFALYVCLTHHILHEGINAVEAHSLSLIPHLGLRSFIHSKVMSHCFAFRRVFIPEMFRKV